MVKIIQTKNNTFTGECYPQPLDVEKLKLGDKGIKIVSYNPYFEPNTRPVVKCTHFKHWLKDQNMKGVIVLLYKGKRRITTLQKEYAKMDVVGGLFMSNSAIMTNLNGRSLNRNLRSKAKHYLNDLLRGQRKDHKDGLLALLNKRLWNITITDKNNQIVFECRNKSEQDSYRILKEELNRRSVNNA